MAAPGEAINKDPLPFKGTAMDATNGAIKWPTAEAKTVETAATAATTAMKFRDATSNWSFAICVLTLAMDYSVAMETRLCHGRERAMTLSRL